MSDNRESPTPPSASEVEIAMLQLTRDGVHQARRAVSVAMISAVVNALVIVVALLVPAYQKSLDDVDKETSLRIQQSTLAMAANDRLHMVDQMLKDGPFTLQGCLQGAGAAGWSNLIEAWIEDDRALSQATLAEPEVAPVARSLMRVARAFHEVSQKSIGPGAPEALAQDVCGSRQAYLRQVASDVQSNGLVALHKAKNPVRRPFGILDGNPRPSLPSDEIPRDDGRGFVDVEAELKAYKF